jgi:hypothetical protein
VSTHVSIYDGAKLLGALDGEPRDAWGTARAIVNLLAHEAGRARLGANHREWYRPAGRNAYERSGFRAVNTFQVRS